MRDMLEQVTLGQSRFKTPGIAPDSRGIALGRFGLIQLANVEALVSWLRVYSAEASLDELLAEMQILRVRTPLQSREILVRIPAVSSYVMDAVSRCARLVGSTLFTGTAKHFVQYRDERAPYGYDAAEIVALAGGAQVMIHARDYTQSYFHEGELSFEKLLFRLSLRKQGGLSNLKPEDTIVLAIEKGLGNGVIRYLWRNQIAGEATLVRPLEQSAFDEVSGTREMLLLRATGMPERIIELFDSTPGIDLYHQITPNIAIEFGYSHAIDLRSCASLLGESRYYLFGGKEDRVDSVDGPLRFSSIEHLTELKADIKGVDARHESTSHTLADVAVPVRLVASLRNPTQIAGTLVPWSQASWVKRLVYLLPPGALSGQRVAATDRGILLLADNDVDTLPLGQFLVELAPGFLVPAGMELQPRVSSQVLASTLGHAAGVITVFPASERPFQTAISELRPLDRVALSAMEVESLSAIDQGHEPSPEPRVANQDIGAFALWGFRAPESE